MKELNGLSANILLAESEKDCRLVATVELILIVNETTYQDDLRGMIKTHPLETLRFASTAAGIRALAKSLLRIAEYAEALEKRAHLDLPPTPQSSSGATPDISGA